MPDDSRQMAPASGRRPTMIKGLMPSLPERGKIKIGIKGAMRSSKGGAQFQPPQKLDHFVVTTLQRGLDGNFLPDETLMQRLGPRPTEIPVRLLYDDPTLNFPTRYACFIGRTLWCSGDGEVATRLTAEPRQLAGGVEPREVACPCHRQDPAYQGKDRCKMNGSLSALVEGAGGLGGVWKFRTTSYNSIVGIMSSMAFIRSITGGVLANIPLKLRVQPKQATAPHDGSQVLIYIVTLEFDGDFAGLQTLAHGIALDRAKTHVSIEHIEEEAKRLLALAPPANAPLPGDDADDVVEEFYPEQADEGWARTPAIAEPEPEPPAAEAESFLVIDADGEEHEYGTTAFTARAIDAVFHDAARRGRASLVAAAENNAVTIGHLAEAERAALRTLYRDLLTDFDVDAFGLSPLPDEPHSPAGAPATRGEAAAPAPDDAQPSPAGEYTAQMALADIAAAETGAALDAWWAARAIDCGRLAKADWQRVNAAIEARRAKVG